VALAQGGKIDWTHGAVATLTMRAFSDGYLDSYLRRCGPDVLASVGAYQIEGPGIGLFERVEGDYFTILGLPLLPLLAELRRRGVLPT
jgi:septum formation protein